MSLRSRLMIAFAYLLLLAVLALSIPLGVHVARRTRDDLAVQLVSSAERAARAMPAALKEGTEALNDLLVEGSDLIRIIAVGADGKLIVDSRSTERGGKDYTYRPEIRAALQGHTTRLVRDYDEDGLQYVVAVPAVRDGKVIGAVRFNQKVATVDALVRRRLTILAGGSLVVLIMGLIVGALIARSLTRPLHELAETATIIGDGDLRARADPAGQREVAEVAHALNTMSRRIEQSIAAQTDFVANASHQLRTPLTGLRLRLEALVATGAPGADAALAETDRLAGLIDDLLTLVRAGVEPEQFDVLDLDEAAQTALDRWTMTAADRGHHLVGDGVGRAPRLVTATTSDVEIILDNLIENALKYTPEGTTITVSLDDTPEGVVLTVADNGPGIAPEDRDRAFERFYRGAANKPVAGTGLGLAIVRQIAERWGGTAQLTSENGTRISVFLPSAEPTADTAELEPVGAAP